MANNKITLNRQGQIFLQGVNRIFLTLESTRGELERSLRKQGDGKLALCMISSTQWVELIAAYSQRYPEVELSCEDVKPTAEAAIRCRAAIDEIVMAEGLEATQEEIGQALAVICRQNNITMEQLKEQYDAALEQAVINSVLTGKVMQRIRDAAIITEE